MPLPRTLHVLGATAAVVLALAPAASADKLVHPLRPAAQDPHQIATPDGRPFFVLSDTAWKMWYRLTRPEIDRYLADRARRGFNVVNVWVYDHVRQTRDGQQAFVGFDVDRPNEQFWQLVDYTFERARHYGLRLGIVPMWASYVTGVYAAPGDPIMLRDPATAWRYGQFLGRRYRDFGPIWILGGEGSARFGGGADTTPIWAALAQGLADGTKLGGADGVFTVFHPWALITPPSSSTDFPNAPWLDANGIHSSHFRARGDQNWKYVLDDFFRQPVRPVWDLESQYEDHPVDFGANPGVFSTADARTRMYAGVFAGAAGANFTNHAIWQLADPAVPDLQPESLPSPVPWQDALSSPGYRQAVYLKRLMLSRPYFGRRPDELLLASPPGDGAARVGALRGRGGRFAMVHLPQGGAVTLRLGRLQARMLRAWWFDPRTGRARRIRGRFPARGERTFSVPGGGTGVGHDWVLVLDDAARRWPAPGARDPRAAVRRARAGSVAAVEERAKGEHRPSR